MYTFILFNIAFLLVSILLSLTIHKTGRYRVNRWLLLSTPLLFFGMMKLGAVQTVTETVGWITLPTVTIGESTIATKSIDYIWLTYVIGVILTILYFSYSFLTILKLRNEHVKEEHFGQTIYRGKITASFFKLIFISNELNDNEVKFAIDHEQAHANQWHSIDRILVVLIQSILWFNPGVYLWKKMIVQNHEYLADQSVLKQKSKKEYGYFLLNQELRSPQPAYHLTSNMSNLKSRIMRMNQTKRKALWIYLAVPAMALTTLSFTVNTSTGINAVKSAVSLEQNDPVSDPDVYPTFQGGNEALGTYLSKNIEYPKNASDNNVEGKVFISFIVDTDGKVSNVEAIKSPNTDLSNEAIRVVQEMPNWTPGEKDGKKVNVKMTLPIMFKLPVKE